MIDINRLFEDSQEYALAVPTDEALSNIAFLARKQQKLERAVERRKKLLEATERKLATVSEVELPDAMAAVGMEDFALDGGYRIKVAREYYANIPSPDSEKPELLDRREKLFAWVREQGHGDLIKEQIIIEAGRGEQEKAQKVRNGLAKAGIFYKDTESIHTSTLKAFVKEQMTKKQEEAAPPFPVQLFGVHVKRVASIGPAKKK